MDKRQKVSYFEQVFDVYAKDIFRYVYSKLSNCSIAEDTTSDVFVKFWHKVNGDTVIQNERAMLYTIAHGLVIDQYRKNKHTTVSIEGVDPIFFGKNDEIEQKIDIQEEIDDIYSKLTRLKKEYQDVLLLRYIEDIEIPEIAKILQKQEGAIRVLIHRALASLKKLYA